MLHVLLLVLACICGTGHGRRMQNSKGSSSLFSHPHLAVSSWKVNVNSASGERLELRQQQHETPPTLQVLRGPLRAAAIAELCFLVALLAYQVVCAGILILLRAVTRCAHIFLIASKPLLWPIRCAFRQALRCSRFVKRKTPGPWLPPLRLILHRCIKVSVHLRIAPCVNFVVRAIGMLLSVVLRPLFFLLDMFSHSASIIAPWIAHGLPFMLPALAAVLEYRKPGCVSHRSLPSATKSVRCLLQNSVNSVLHSRLPFARYVLALAAARIAITCNKGLSRSMMFNMKMVPLAIDYRFYQWLLQPASDEEKMRTWARLHAKHVPEVMAAIYKLRGFYIKIGQVISSFGDSFIATEYVEALRVLQDSVPAQPPKCIRRIAEKELGAPLEEYFCFFDLEQPLGAASIGQVHAATLHNGLDVVVKLQYPEAEKFFRNDMRCLKYFCAIFAPENVKLLEEIEKQFATEFDYRLEASLLRQAATNLMPHFPQVVIPLPIDRVHPDGSAKLCTRHCLVMERLKGMSLLAAQTAQLERFAALSNTTAEQLRRELEAKFRAGQLKKPVLPSSFLIDCYTQYLNAVDAVCNIGNALMKKPLVRTEPPINAPKLIDFLFDVHGHQLFYDGFFNGDPHPGNIMLLEDGRVGLIDWGQVKRMGMEDRVKLARLIIALADRDQVLTAELWADCGFITQHMDPWCLDKWATWRFSRFTPDVTDIFNGVLDFELRLGALDPLEEEPQEYVMAFRLSALMRGSAMGLGDVTADSAKRWRRHAVRLLRAQRKPIPKTRYGRRLPSKAFLVKTEAMRDLKPSALESNSIF